jgi:hypothetical protein
MLVLKTMESIPSTQSESFIEGALLNQPSLFKKFLFAVAVFEGILDFGFQHFNLGANFGVNFLSTVWVNCCFSVYHQ